MEIQIDQARLKAIRKEAEEEFYRQYRKVVFDEITTQFQKQLLYSDAHGNGKGKEYQTEGAMRTLTNCMTDSWYQTHKNACAFFQGGSHDPNGNWFYVEFWNFKGAQAYIDKFNAEFDDWVRDVWTPMQS